MRAMVAKSKNIILTASKHPNQLYYLDVPKSQSETAYLVAITPTSKLERLHHQLGHLNYVSICSLVWNGIVTGIKLTQEELKFKPSVCASYALGKITRASFLLLESGRASQFLGLVHLEL